MKFSTTHPIAREAFPFLLLSVGLAIFCWLAAVFFPFRPVWFGLGTVCLITAVYVLWFFRHPRRPIPLEKNVLLCPADGTVVAVGQVPHPAFPDGQAVRVAIFMSLFDVHINWSPCDAIVERTEYYPGKFLNAMEEKSSDENERKILFLRTSEGELVVVKLVAGLVARRIVSPLERGDQVTRGETIGLIRFGSRVEILAPSIYQPCVQKGDRVHGRTTILLTRSSERKIIDTQRHE